MVKLFYHHPGSVNCCIGVYFGNGIGKLRDSLVEHRVKPLLRGAWAGIFFPPLQVSGRWVGTAGGTYYHASLHVVATANTFMNKYAMSFESEGDTKYFAILFAVARGDRVGQFAFGTPGALACACFAMNESGCAVVKFALYHALPACHSLILVGK